MPNGCDQDVARPERTPGARRSLIRDLGWLTVAVVLAFATATFVWDRADGVRGGQFVWLDHSQIQGAGYRIVGAEDWGSIWVATQEQYQSGRAGVDPQEGGSWRPVYALSISLDWLLWEGRAWCYHVENVCWHLLVVVGLYLLGRRLFDPLPGGRRAVFWATLLFAVHPFGVYSVTWISGRADTMCAAFGVWALLAFAQVAADEAAARANRRRIALWLTVSGVCLVLSVGSKELGMVVPLVATALFWPALRTGGYPKRRRLRQVRLAGLGVLWVCAATLGVYRVAVVGAWGPDAAYPTDSIVRNAATSANLWWHYVLRILTPSEVRLSDAWPVVQAVGWGEVLAMLGILALLAGLAVGCLRRWPPAYGLLWYVIWMLPAAGLFPLRYFRAERYLYPASWGLLLAVTMIFLLPVYQGGSKSAKRVASVVLIGLVLCLMLTTAYANTLWWNDSDLFEYSLSQDPRHLQARMMVGGLALQEGMREGNRDKVAQAVQHYRRVVDDLDDASFVAYADPYGAHFSLGRARFELRLYGEALPEFEAALQHRPDSPGVHYYAGLAAFAVGDLPSAKEHFERALELAPAAALYRHNLAVTLLRLGEAEACVRLLGDHVRDHEGDLISREDLASALLVLQRFDEAGPHFEVLVRNRPENPIHRAQLAWCQWKTGEQEEAKRNLQRARDKAPTHPVVLQVARMIDQEQAEPEDPEDEEQIEGGREKGEGRGKRQSQIPNPLRPGQGVAVEPPG